MIDIFGIFFARIRVRITSANPAALITRLNESHLPLYDVDMPSDLVVEASVYRQDYPRLIKEIQRRGDKAEILHRDGVYWEIKRLLHRPVIICLLFLLLLAVTWLPGKIFFVQVEGNSTISDKLILARAQDCGIYFGASRREVRSERVKNALLQAIPELKWAGVNTKGCVATINVKERIESASQKPENGVASIVATHDGIVSDITVTKGTPLCSIGEAVKQGETLVSGYTDCGFKIQASIAQAEVYGVTTRQLQVVMPINYADQGEISRSVRKYSIKIGKNKIKFYKDSGISPRGCDKMYSEYYWMLPGGFCLPVAFVVEEYVFYESNAQHTSAGADSARLRTYAEEYLASQMISGTILARNFSVEQTQSGYMLNGAFTCRESIGRLQNEETIWDHGEND